MTNMYANRHQARPQGRRSGGHALQFSWNAIFFGFLLGVFVTCLSVFMFSTNDITLKIPTGSHKPQRIAQANVPIAEPAKPVAPTVQEPRYDFYTELAKSDVEPASDLKTREPTINGYVVQAGAFKKANDADALRAKLTLNGFTPKLDRIAKSNGDAVHRVLLGTFKNEQNAKKLQQQLKTAGIDSTLVLSYANE